VREKWWAGTGLNRRHQDFQVLGWVGLSATIGNHPEEFQALGGISVSVSSRWHPMVSDGSDTNLTQRIHLMTGLRA
jgi:hypothetical protein